MHRIQRRGRAKIQGPLVPIVGNRLEFAGSFRIYATAQGELVILKKWKITMKNRKQDYSVVYITHSERGYYVGQTGDAPSRYSDHKSQGREVIADFLAPDIPVVRVELERALLQFCEGVGFPLENRWYADSIYYQHELEEGAY